VQQNHDFRDEAEMQAYQVSLAEELAEMGWLLLGVDVERRSGKDRRTARRSSSDRRSETFAGTAAEKR
jgi:hypothetical protein